MPEVAVVVSAVSAARSPTSSTSATAARLRCTVLPPGRVSATSSGSGWLSRSRTSVVSCSTSTGSATLRRTILVGTGQLLSGSCETTVARPSARWTLSPRGAHDSGSRHNPAAAQAVLLLFAQHSDASCRRRVTSAAPGRLRQCALVCRAVVNRLTVGDDHMLERKLQQAMKRGKRSLLQRRAVPDKQLTVRRGQRIGENQRSTLSNPQRRLGTPTTVVQREQATRNHAAGFNRREVGSWD